MKLATAVKYGLGTAILSSHNGFKGVDAVCCTAAPALYCPCCNYEPIICPNVPCYDCNPPQSTAGGSVTSATDGRRKLTAVEGDVVVGNLVADASESSNFLATNATGFDKFVVAIPDSENCSDGALLVKAKKVQIQQPLDLSTDFFGNVQSGDWRAQSITEIQDANTTLPVSLADLINGVKPEYGLAVYFLSSDEELLGCARLKQLDEAVASMYSEMFYGFSDDDAVKKDTTSSGSKKNGVLFVFASAIAAVGIAFVLGKVLAL
jgi:hypothetical protein